MDFDKHRLLEQRQRSKLLDGLDLGWRRYFNDDVQGIVPILQTILSAIDGIMAEEQCDFEMSGNAWDLMLTREGATAEPFYGGYVIQADLEEIRTFVVRYLESLHVTSLLDQGERLVERLSLEWRMYIETDIHESVDYLEEILDEIENIRSGKKSQVRMTSDFWTLALDERGATVDNSYFHLCPRWDLESFRAFLLAYTDVLRSYFCSDPPTN